jgi:hypothetical protein
MAKLSLSTSDVYLRYTAVYTWSANQTAHAGMGFFFTSLVMLCAYRLGASGWYWWGLLFMIVPLVKDTGDYLSDACVEGRLFPVYHGELVRDGVADGFFWSAGTIFAVGVAQLYDAQPDELTRVGQYWLVAVIGIAVLAGLFICYFRGEKRAFDKSGLLYYYRLPSFSPVHNPDLESAKLCKSEVEAIEDFVEQKPGAVDHLIVGGKRGTGKTTLGVSIGSGLTVRIHGSQKVRYLTWTKLIEALPLDAAGSKSQNTEPWHLGEADYLIVDDLPSGRIRQTEKHKIEAALNSHDLEEKKVVWITGEGDAIRHWTEIIAAAVANGNGAKVPFPVDLSRACAAGDEAEVHSPSLFAPFCYLTKAFQYGFYFLLLAVIIGVILVTYFVTGAPPS